MYIKIYVSKIMFFIYFRNKSIKLKAYKKLPNVDECQPILAMPNRVSPSDHLPLFAIFSYPIK